MNNIIKALYNLPYHKRKHWQNVLRNTIINISTIQHLVGLPNNPRDWTRDCYHLLGGHCKELLVADDYDILVRTFHCTKYAAIPDLLYIQYRNETEDNSTFTRNTEIQTLVKELSSYYNGRILKRVKELELREYVPYSRVWNRVEDDPGLKQKAPAGLQ